MHPLVRSAVVSRPLVIGGPGCACHRARPPPPCTATCRDARVRDEVLRANPSEPPEWWELEHGDPTCHCTSASLARWARDYREEQADIREARGLLGIAAP